MNRRTIVNSLLAALLLSAFTGWETHSGARRRAFAAACVGDESVYRDRVRAAWRGKSIGLIAGCPSEGFGRERIKRKSRETRFHHITGYMPAHFETWLTNCRLRTLDALPPNDDTDLMLASLLALREHGTDLTFSLLADTWLKYVPGAWSGCAISRKPSAGTQSGDHWNACHENNRLTIPSCPDDPDCIDQRHLVHHRRLKEPKQDL